jgi:hypothetical protein
MPYKSSAQRAFFHSPGAKAAGIRENTVEEWDAASKGLTNHDLPAHVGTGKGAAKRVAAFLALNPRKKSRKKP